MTACRWQECHYSHSVVPGGLAVRSYRTLDIPGTVDTLSTILFRAYRGKQKGGIGKVKQNHFVHVKYSINKQI